MTAYDINRVISRSVSGKRLRPVRKEDYVDPYLLQSVPPYGWCVRCGGEVYREGVLLCKDCRASAGKRKRLLQKQPL